MDAESCNLFRKRNKSEGTIHLKLEWSKSGNLPKILSIEAFEGKVQLKIENCRFNRSGISFLPPPG